jgi:hypothetical protein
MVWQAVTNISFCICGKWDGVRIWFSVYHLLMGYSSLGILLTATYLCSIMNLYLNVSTILLFNLTDEWVGNTITIWFKKELPTYWLITSQDCFLCSCIYIDVIIFFCLAHIHRSCKCCFSLTNVISTLLIHISYAYTMISVMSSHVLVYVIVDHVII